MKRQTLFLSFLVCCLLAPTLILAKDAPWTPLKGKSQIRVIDVQWANPAQPFSNATSLFDGRCTVPSNYIITFSMVGEVTHLGRITGIAEHCTQLNFGANNSPCRLTATANSPRRQPMVTSSGAPTPTGRPVAPTQMVCSGSTTFSLLREALADSWRRRAAARNLALSTTSSRCLAVRQRRCGWRAPSHISF